MKILICSDGCAQAERAVRFIVSIAAACEAEFTLLGIVETPADEVALMDGLKQQLQILRDQNVRVELITKSGQPVEQIKAHTDAVRYDLVVIGAVRKGSGGPYCMSAKAYHIIRLIHPPVLAVIGARSELKRILICSGGRSYIDKAIALVCKAETAVTILHVTAGPPLMYAHLVRQTQDVEKLLASKSRLGRNLRREKQSLAALGVKATVRVRQGFVVEEIFKEIKAGDYDLVVTGSSPSSGAIHTYIMGDVTSEIVNRANTPVLVVRGDGPAVSGFGRLLRWFRGLRRKAAHAPVEG